MTIRLLFPVGNDNAGAVLTVSEDRARRLLMTGYAEQVQAPVAAPKKKSKQDKE